MEERLQVFCCYAHADQPILSELKNHLKIWERQNFIAIWTDADISPGIGWQEEIIKHIETAQIILLLVSSDFIASEYCYSTEMIRAMERYKNGNALVIPIILRHCVWEDAPFGKLQALPTGARPVLDPGWHTQDEAFADIARGIRNIITAWSLKASSGKDHTDLSALEQSTAGEVNDNSVRKASITHATPEQLIGSPSQPPMSQSLRAVKAASRVLIYHEHRSLISALAWSPDGRYIASASWDKTVRVWDASSGQTFHVYCGHAGRSSRNWLRRKAGSVNALAWSPSGAYIASAGDDKTVQIWEAITGLKKTSFSSKEEIHGMSWSPDGRYIAFLPASFGEKGDYDYGWFARLEIWEANTGHKVCTCRGFWSNNYFWATSPPCSLAWSPDSSLIASAFMDDDVRIWDALTGSELLTYHSSHTDALSWSPDGKCIASTAGSRVNVWEVATSHSISTFSGHKEHVFGVVWSPNNDYIASVGKDRTVRVWRAMTGQEVLVCRGHTSSVLAIAWSPDGAMLVSGGNDGVIHVWQLI